MSEPYRSLNCYVCYPSIRIMVARGKFGWVQMKNKIKYMQYLSVSVDFHIHNFKLS